MNQDDLISFSLIKTNKNQVKCDVKDARKFKKIKRSTKSKENKIFKKTEWDDLQFLTKDECLTDSLPNDFNKNLNNCGFEGNLTEELDKSLKEFTYIENPIKDFKKNLGFNFEVDFDFLEDEFKENFKKSTEMVLDFNEDLNVNVDFISNQNEDKDNALELDSNEILKNGFNDNLYENLKKSIDEIHKTDRITNLNELNNGFFLNERDAESHFLSKQSEVENLPKGNLYENKEILTKYDNQNSFINNQEQLMSNDSMFNVDQQSTNRFQELDKNLDELNLEIKDYNQIRFNYSSSDKDRLIGSNFGENVDEKLTKHQLCCPTISFQQYLQIDDFASTSKPLNSKNQLNLANNKITYSNMGDLYVTTISNNINIEINNNFTTNDKADLNNSEVIKKDFIDLNKLNETLLKALISKQLISNQTSMQNYLKKTTLNSIINNTNGHIKQSTIINGQDYINQTNSDNDKFKNSPDFKINSNLNTYGQVFTPKSSNNYLIVSNNNSELFHEEINSEDNLKEDSLTMIKKYKFEKKTVVQPANQISQSTHSSLQKSANCLNSLYSLANQISTSIINQSSNGAINLNNRNNESNFSEKICNPFSIECRIPLPGSLTNENNFYAGNKNFIKKRNQRERIRVKTVNDGFESLRKVLPTDYEQYFDQNNYLNCYLDNSNNSVNSINELSFKNLMVDDKLFKNNLSSTGKQTGTYSISSPSSTSSSTSNKERRLSKVETLRLAISYIKHLKNILNS